MNVPSIEYGWKISDAKIDFNNSEVPNLLINDYSVFIETHPWNPKYIFISLGKLEEDFQDEPLDTKQIILDWLLPLYPDIKLKWGVIHTERQFLIKKLSPILSLIPYITILTWMTIYQNQV